ncbi:MAG: periplasmic binding protein [Bacteroidetes bacterium]|jgi:iron complex transport system substrate-binding protein|nr:periplasmic binding protein [Bacteroidota bacterium]
MYFYPHQIQRMFRLFIILFSLFLFACNTSVEQKKQNETATNTSLSYAKRFAVKKYANYTVLELLGNKNDAEVTASFVLYRKEKPVYTKDAYYIKTPVSRVACMSSIYTTMLAELHCEQFIVAIDNVDYYTNPYIQQKVTENKVIELSKGPQIEIEKTIALKPDLFLTFGMGNPKTDIDQKLLQSGLPVAISIDHLEETPLARAEWIKFFACFFNKEAMADSLFTATAKRYNDLKMIAQQNTHKPTVLTEIKYGDAWYVPSGKSYMANLINDAGGNYFWKDDQKVGSTPLPFEKVYAKAKDCDFWINQYNVNTRKELISYDERYGLFKAFKEGNLYNNNKVQNSGGYSNYWETGITHPDDVLADLIKIFAPAFMPQHEFVYYKKIQ